MDSKDLREKTLKEGWKQSFPRFQHYARTQKKPRYSGQFAEKFLDVVVARNEVGCAAKTGAENGRVGKCVRALVSMLKLSEKEFKELPRARLLIKSDS